MAAAAGSWWAGENLTNQNSFRTSNFFSTNAPSGYQAVQAGNAADAAAFAASLASGQPTPPLHNISWQIVGGPYPTEAAADAAIPAIEQAHPAPGAFQQAVSGWTGNIEKWLIRGFEMLLGIGLIVIAVAKLAGDTKAGKAAKAVAGKAVLL